MRFASIGGSNAGNYAAAGKSVADSAAKMHAVQRKTGPDYTGLSKVAMATASQEKQAAINAEAKLTNVAQKVYADQVQNEIKIDVINHGQEIKQKQRKAGGLAAIGKIAGAGFLAATDNTKGRERPKADRQSILDKFNADNKASNERYNAGVASIGEFKPSTGVSSGKATTGGTTGSSVTGAGNLKPSETGQAYMKKLTESGMSKQQAAALVGHLKVESDNFQADTEYAPNAYGTKGRGHLQWTDTGNSGGRRTNFESFANSEGLSPTSFEANSQFLLSEMRGNHGNHWTNGGSMEGFLQTSSINDASSYLQSNFIRPGVPHTERRLQGAHAAFNAFQ
tara:strand:- start:694 stop:1707 length:1014 start_codon:yes stop_codon:yes gene_type:complete